MNNIALFVSGSGTNAENIIRYFSGHESINVSIVLSNKPDAYAMTRAYRLGVPSFVFTRKMLEDGTVARELKHYGIDYIILAGFLLKIPEALISEYPDRIINIHPALLPKYGGKGMYGHHVHEAVVAAGERESGITIHLANCNYDEGGHLFQAKCPVTPEDTADDVAAKIHELEQAHFPSVIEKYILSGK